MKRYKFLFCILVGLLISGCHAFFGNEAQYKDGDWYLFAGSQEVARIRQDKLAIDKLNSRPPQTSEKDGVFQGYLGVVANLSRYVTYNFHLIGPEKKAYMLGPGQQVRDHLIPGMYIARIFLNGREIGQPRSFRVGPQQHYFMGEWTHWYVTRK
jgi:hypothetical protein